MSVNHCSFRTSILYYKGIFTAHLVIREKNEKDSAQRSMDMKKSSYLILVTVLLLFASTSTDYAYAGGGGYHHGGGGYHGGGYHGGGGYYRGGHYHGGYWRGSIWIGPGWGWAGWGPWWGAPYYSYPYPYYPYSASPPVVIERQAPTYVQPGQPQESYWYHCENPEGYYPYVRNCPGGWTKVAPHPAPTK